MATPGFTGFMKIIGHSTSVSVVDYVTLYIIYYVEQVFLFH